MKKSVISESQIMAAINEQESGKRWQFSAVEMLLIISLENNDPIKVPFMSPKVN
jgi:hypothetical protein